MTYRSRLMYPACLVFGFVFLAGCGQSSEPVPRESGSDAAGHVAATPSTLAHNAGVAQRLALDEQSDFEQARRGLIAAPESLLITTAKGETAWDMPAYAFVEGDAPETVNPSLWRQAKLNGIHGLFEVTEGVYQLRGFDLANLTLIDSDSGWIVVDPLTTAATSKAAMAFAREHLGDKNVVAVVFTHSHVDHFGGVEGALRESEYEGLQVIAPEGFLKESISENLLAGGTMQRRATFMYGRNLPTSPRGHVDTGLGKEPAKGGMVGILEPTVTISETGQRLLVDGVEMIFQNAGGSEAPAELTFYLPSLKAFCGAEVMSRNMHNVYTPRGAKVRDALAWSGFINEALDEFGRQSDVYFASHHWPIWGNQQIVEYMEQQRDTYKYIHDQTLRMANGGATPREIAEDLRLPTSLQSAFSSRGYYGTVSHNAKAVYQGYFGWYDGNPANLNPLPPVAAASRYLEYMGGAEAVLERAEQSYEQGDYRWVAEVVNHVVFAEPDNLGARGLLAKAYDQLAYQAESGPWRDIYLTGAYELRHGAPESGATTDDAEGVIRRIPSELFFEVMAASLNGERAEGEQYLVNIHLTDTDERFVLTIDNAVLNYRKHEFADDADATLSLTRPMFLDLMTNKLSITDALMSDDFSIAGGRLALAGFFSLFDTPEPAFNIVTP
ncbi:MAG: alkyl sulfatase dimerization domain-containing protein [Halieaceae bacterium]